MSIISELRVALRRKPKSAEEQIAGVTDALAKLHAEREVVQNSISTAAARRRALLLEDAPDEAVEELDREVDRAVVLP